jgi:hypothetical protein
MDPAATRVASAPTDVTFAKLMELDQTAPSSASLTTSTPRIAPVELTVYRVTARLISMKQEADLDFHVVIADPSNSSVTMVAEIPDPACASQSVTLTQIRAVRNAFVAAYGRPGKSAQRVPGRPVVTVTGVGFFDECTAAHKPTGAAPHCLELHPVLSIVP